MKTKVILLLKVKTEVLELSLTTLSLALKKLVEKFHKQSEVLEEQITLLREIQSRHDDEDTSAMEASEHNA